MTFVIVGAGLAGAKAAQTLREEGFDGSILLVGRESLLPYERPPLSKDYLWGTAEFDSAIVHPAEWYAEQNIELRRGVEAVDLNTSSRQLALSDGSQVAYDKLLLTTGLDPIRPSVPGADAAVYLRNKPDSDRLREALAPGRKVVIVGAGWIGLEVAAGAIKAGADVTVIDLADLPLKRSLGTTVASIYADEHRRQGVTFRLGTAVQEITASGVLTDDGEVPADLVVVGIGARPNTQLAEQAGLEVDNGILTDAGLLTSDPNVYAAGDVANAFHPRYDRHVRVEHWANALNQGPAAARAMLGQAVTYDRTPYLYSDQYDLGMEHTGWYPLDSDPDVVLRGDVDGRSFQAFWLGEEQPSGHRDVLAAMHVNRWDDGIGPLKAIVESREPVDPTRLGDESVPLTDLVPQPDEG